MEYKEEDFLLLSGLQHFKFCRRRWALIHIENQWAENFRTVDGALLHKNAHDKGLHESRGDLIITRGMHVFSAVLGVSGECDVLEFHRGVATTSAAAIPCSFAGRRSVWRRCSAAPFRRARSITAKHAAEFPYHSPMSCDRRCGNA